MVIHGESARVSLDPLAYFEPCLTRLSHWTQLDSNEQVLDRFSNRLDSWPGSPCWQAGILGLVSYRPLLKTRYFASGASERLFESTRQARRRRPLPQSSLTTYLLFAADMYNRFRSCPFSVRPRKPLLTGHIGFHRIVKAFCGYYTVLRPHRPSADVAAPDCVPKRRLNHLSLLLSVLLQREE
jgi:hypothetical protein